MNQRHHHPETDLHSKNSNTTSIHFTRRSIIDKTNNSISFRDAN
jgi:hypothetical protein